MDEKPSWQRSVFEFGLVAEIAVLILLWIAVTGYGVIMLAIPLASGLVTSGVGLFARPRSLGAIVTFVLHAAFFGGFAVDAAWDKARERHYARRHEEEKREYWRQTHWRKELEALVVEKKYAEARAFVEGHAQLKLGYGMPLPAVLCPKDHSPPDLPLLRAMGTRGAPTGGDLLVEPRSGCWQTHSGQEATPSSAGSRSMVRSGVAAFQSSATARSRWPKSYETCCARWKSAASVT